MRKPEKHLFKEGWKLLEKYYCLKSKQQENMEWVERAKAENKI